MYFSSFITCPVVYINARVHMDFNLAKNPSNTIVATEWNSVERGADVEGLEGVDGVGALVVGVAWIEVKGDDGGAVVVCAMVMGGGREALACVHGNDT
jgi:hypothetical protein